MADLAMGFTAVDVAHLAAISARVAQAEVAVAAAQAERARAYAEAEFFAQRATGGMRASRDRDMARRAVAAEIAVPLRVSDRTVQREMADAAGLVSDYPLTLAAWEAGRIHRRHVDEVVRAGALLPADERHAFDERAVGVCERMSSTRAKGALPLLAERMHPTTPTARHQAARETRCVSVSATGEGMSRVVADVPTILGEGIHDRLTRIATALADAREQARARLREQRAAGVAEDALDPADIALAADVRTRDHVRADTFCDLLLAGQPGWDPTADADGSGELGAIRARVQVVVNASTLAGWDEDAADLVGAAPVDAGSARQLAGDCTGFDRLFVDPVSRQVTETDRYTPTVAMRRHLRARDRHCRFPGCRVPALRCETDHTLDWARGGPTRLTNLAHLCQRHHSMKQFTSWRVRQLGDGALEWTSPAGRVYVDDPPTPTVCFIPDDGSPPPF